MAERRMISKKITDTDAFLDMPLSTQALYFHFVQNADDDGFVGSPNSIIRKIGANRNDYDLLIAKRFVIAFETGICVIKHWRIHNYIQSDRYNPTTYLKEKSTLLIEENKSYTQKIDNCIQDVYIVDTQDSIGKNRLEEISIDKKEINIKEKKHIYGEYKHVRLTDEEYNKLIDRFGEEKTKSMITNLDEGIELKGYKYQSHYMAILKWNKKNKGEKSNGESKGSMYKDLR